MKNEIFQRVYQAKRGFNGQGLPYITWVRAGLLLAVNSKDGILYGASALHPEDKYNDETAFAIARKSLRLNPYGPTRFPTKVQKDLERFVNRAQRYFKK